MNSLKWSLVGLLVVAALIGNYQFSDQSMLIRIIAMLLVLGTAFFIALKTPHGKKLTRFATDSKSELRKVVWPSRKETIQTTIIVMVMVTIASVFLWGVDALLLQLVAWITGYGAV